MRLGRDVGVTSRAAGVTDAAGELKMAGARKKNAAMAAATASIHNNVSIAPKRAKKLAKETYPPVHLNS